MDKLTNYVPALRERIVRIEDSTSDNINLSILQPLEGSEEKTTGIDRSLALCIRLIPFTVIWLVMAVSISTLLSMGNAFSFVLFAGLTSVTYSYLDRQERQFSRNGLERHKINTFADLSKAQMAHNQELKRMTFKANLQLLGIKDKDSDTD